MTIHRPGETIGGRYDIVEFVGEGGMQEVYSANDTLLSRVVALKTPKTNSAHKRFRRSAQTSARINHANVAKTLDYMGEERQPYLIEELVDGCDLGVFLSKYVSSLDPYACAHVLHHLAKGLAASHHANVIHRDIKPSNIMVVGGAGFNGIKITDFGIAKMAEAEIGGAVMGGGEALTQSATALGALPYMSPEMIDLFTSADKPTDIWSLGALTFELLTGGRPFGSGYAAVPRIQAAVVPALPQYLARNNQFAELAVDIHNIIGRCLARDPADRPTADDLVSLCESLCYNLGRREFGTVQRFNYQDDGFVTADQGRSVHFHQRSVPGDTRVAIGDRVWFARHRGQPSDRAFPLVKAIPAS